MAAVAAQGMAPAGPVFSRHFKMTPVKMTPEVFDPEVGVPVAKPVSLSGRVQPGQLPSKKVARTVHGDYEGLGGAWGEFDAWIAANGYRQAPDLWECDVTGPETSTDPAAWRTELTRPLVA